MITCSVCGEENDDLAVLCVSCRSYLQSKVDNLDLFQTIWQLIESPRSALKKVVLASHKNYLFLLSSLLGISMAFGFFWLNSLGPQFTNILTLVGTAGLLGIPLGLVVVLLSTVLGVNVIRLFGGKTSLRNTMAVVSYSSVPIVLSLVFILPLEIAIFGIDFFGMNPPPMVINPVVYVALIAFDALASLWTVLLLFQGMMVLTGFSRVKSMLLALVIASVPGALPLGLKLL